MPRATQYEEPPPQEYRQRPSGLGGLIITGIILAVVAVAALCAIRWETVKGNELGIKETFSGGVQNTILQPKTYMLWRGIEDIFQYDMSSQVYDLNDYKVQSVEGQDLTIKLSLRYRLDPAQLVQVHKTLRTDIAKKVIEPTVQRVVKDEATRLKATDAYSGEGLVKLQSTIQTDLANPANELRGRGVIVETFVIRHIDLDPKYIDVIKMKQIAAQEQLAAIEEQKAAEAKALVAKSLAQADLNKQVVEAERDAKVKVLTAQAAMEKAVLDAKGAQQTSTLEAEGKMQAAISEAKGIEALGRANAEAQKLKLMAFDVKGAEGYITVEVAKSVSSGMQNIQGFLPANMSVSVISEDIMKSVQTLVGKRPVAASK